MTPRTLIGNIVMVIGLGVLWLIPLYFVLSWFGIVPPPLEAFGIFGYGIVTAIVIGVSVGLWFIAEKIRGKRF